MAVSKNSKPAVEAPKSQGAWQTLKGVQVGDLMARGNLKGGPGEYVAIVAIENSGSERVVKLADGSTMSGGMATKFWVTKTDSVAPVKAQPAKAQPAKAQPAKAAAEVVAEASEKVQLRAGFDVADAIAATGKKLNALCVEAGGPAAGMNPSQLRRMLVGQVNRVEKGRAAIIAKNLGVAFDKMWDAPDRRHHADASPHAAHAAADDDAGRVTGALAGRDHGADQARAVPGRPGGAVTNTFASAKSDVEHAELLLNRAVGVYRNLAPDSEATTELTAAHRAVWEWRVNHD